MKYKIEKEDSIKQQDLFVEDGFGNLKPNPYITGEKQEPKQQELDLEFQGEIMQIKINKGVIIKKTR